MKHSHNICGYHSPEGLEKKTKKYTLCLHILLNGVHIFQKTVNIITPPTTLLYTLQQHLSLNRYTYISIHTYK